MTSKEFITHWNNLHRYDYWWRQKYHIAFNSEQHRQSNQFNIALEYQEYSLSMIAFEDHQKRKKNQEEYEKTKVWIKPSEEDSKKSDELFDNLDLSDLR